MLRRPVRLLVVYKVFVLDLQDPIVFNPKHQHLGRVILMQRREFLQRASAVAGASIAASAERSSGADEPARGKTYRVGVIGSTGRGDYGHAMDRAWLEIPRTRIVAVADDNTQGLAMAAERLSVKQTFADYHQMLADVDLDIVAICPRWVDQHRDMAVAAARRGKHILIEKPFCRTLAEADEIVDACEKSNAKLAFGHPTNYSPKLDTVKRMIADGKIGRVLEYRARGKEDERRGGGHDLWVLGTHIMGMIRAIGSHPKWCFAQVLQDGKPVRQEDVYEGPEGFGPLAGDAVHAMYGMPDGSVAYFSSVRSQAGRARYALNVHGTEGVIEIQEGLLPSVKYLKDRSWSPGRSGASWQDVSSAGIGKPEPLSGRLYQARYMLQINDLLDSIEKNRQPKCSVYDALGATEMIVAVFDSHRVGGPVALPLENRENPLTMLST